MFNRSTNSSYGNHAHAYLHSFHKKVVDEVQEAVQNQPVVVVGMFLNPYVLWARFTLWQAKIPYTYRQYGGYLTCWKAHLAIKMWSGWPTFPQIFVNGTLIGGSKCLRRSLKDGSLVRLLEETPAEASSNS